MIRSRDMFNGAAACVFSFSVACAAARTGFEASGPLLSRLDFFIMGFSVGVPLPGSFPNLLIWLGMDLRVHHIFAFVKAIPQHFVVAGQDRGIHAASRPNYQTPLES